MARRRNPANPLSHRPASFFSHPASSAMRQHHIGMGTPRQAKRIGKRMGRISGSKPASASNHLLHAAAHHGTPSLTHHGIGGIKPHQIKPPKVKMPKAGVSIRHTHGQVKIPNSMHTPRPGKGMHNHIHIPKAPKPPKVKMPKMSRPRKAKVKI